ncbi:MAG: hypothetical protein AAF152_08040 [Cyanobacteria bacterium P01_A01_bin.114]
MLRFRAHFRYLFALSLLITTAGVRPASAETLGKVHMGLDFSLPSTDISGPARGADRPATSSSEPSEPVAVTPGPRYEPLAIPPDAIAPPVQTQAANNPRVYATKVYAGTAGVAIAAASDRDSSSQDMPSSRVAQLPPPPEAIPTSLVLKPLRSPSANSHSEAIALRPSPTQKHTDQATADQAVSGKSATGRQQSLARRESQPARQKPLGLSFDPDQNTLPPTAEPSSQTVIAAQPVNLEAPDPGHIFEGGSDSLVARIVGSAEGTRTADGQRTPAYYGHTDPGNGVWNQGTFSYQHRARSPEEADAKQLARLQRQGQTLEHKAAQNGIELSLVEKLNGLDLANQAPLAALDRGGYVERLAEARQQGMDGADAILWARTRAYIDPDTQRWDAPGLGNNIHSISRDQARRLEAINSALAGYETAKIIPAQITPAQLSSTEAEAAPNLDFDKPTVDIFDSAEDTPGRPIDSFNASVADGTESASANASLPLEPASSDTLFSAPGMDEGLSFALIDKIDKIDKTKPRLQATPQSRIWPSPQTSQPARPSGDLNANPPAVLPLN